MRVACGPLGQLACSDHNPMSRRKHSLYALTNLGARTQLTNVSQEESRKEAELIMSAELHKREDSANSDSL